MMTLSQTGAASRFLARAVAHLRDRGRASAEARLGLALLADRLGHERLARDLVVSMPHITVDSAPTRVVDVTAASALVASVRAAWLHRELGRRTGAAYRPAGRELVDALRVAHGTLAAARHVDLINGAGGVALMLWQALDPSGRANVAPSLVDTVLQMFALPPDGLFHGNAGGLALLDRMRRTGASTGPAGHRAEQIVASLVAGAANRPNDVRGMGGGALCLGLPGTIVGLGRAADAAALADAGEAVAATLTAQLSHTSTASTDPTVCHGVAGPVLAVALAPVWRGILGPHRLHMLQATIGRHLDATDPFDTFTTSLTTAVLSGPLGVALALVETARQTDDPPWWTDAFGLPAAADVCAGTTR